MVNCYWTHFPTLPFPLFLLPDYEVRCLRRHKHSILHLLWPLFPSFFFLPAPFRLFLSFPSFSLPYIYFLPPVASACCGMAGMVVLARGRSSVANKGYEDVRASWSECDSQRNKIWWLLCWQLKLLMKELCICCRSWTGLLMPGIIIRLVSTPACYWRWVGSNKCCAQLPTLQGNNFWHRKG